MAPTLTIASSARRASSARLSTAVNVHFDDRFERGEIQFDYVMKPGPVTHSNAIALMRAVGLDVPQSNHDGFS